MCRDLHNVFLRKIINLNIYHVGRQRIINTNYIMSYVTFEQVGTVCAIFKQCDIRVQVPCLLLNYHLSVVLVCQYKWNHYLPLLPHLK